MRGDAPLGQAFQEGGLVAAGRLAHGETAGPGACSQEGADGRRFVGDAAGLAGQTVEHDDVALGDVEAENLCRGVLWSGHDCAILGWPWIVRGRAGTGPINSPGVAGRRQGALMTTGASPIPERSTTAGHPGLPGPGDRLYPTTDRNEQSRTSGEPDDPGPKNSERQQRIPPGRIFAFMGPGSRATRLAGMTDLVLHVS